MYTSSSYCCAITIFTLRFRDDSMLLQLLLEGEMIRAGVSLLVAAFADGLNWAQPLLLHDNDNDADGEIVVVVVAVAVERMQIIDDVSRAIQYCCCLRGRRYGRAFRC